MPCSLSNVIHNLDEGIHKIKCKYGHDNKNCETCGIKCKDCVCFLEYINFQGSLIEYKFLCCNNNHQKKLNESLKKRLGNT